jgi:hypothetical protein
MTTLAPAPLARATPLPPDRDAGLRDPIVTIPVGSLSAEESKVLATAPCFLRRALRLKNWFAAAERANGFDQRFDLTRSFHRPETSYAFFGRLFTQEGGVLPVMGAVEEMFYDQTRTPNDRRLASAHWMKEQVREFVLRYFLRISSFRPPEAYWKPEARADREGLGYIQLFAKPRGGDKIVRFASASQQTMVDVREIGPVYDWTVAKVQIFDFSFLVPLIRDRAGMQFELHEDSYLILSPEFVVDIEEPATGVLGEYGFGYAFIRNPVPGPLAFGPGEFEAAYKTFVFRVLETGEVQLRMEFVVNRPSAALRVSLNPAKWGMALADALTFGRHAQALDRAKRAVEAAPGASLHFDPVYPAIDLMNFLTGGYASREWGISRDALDRLFLLQHFHQHYRTVVGSLLNWRQIPNWLDTRNLPRWVVTGADDRST